MVAIRKVDGRLSKTVVFNAAMATLAATVPLLPQLQAVIPPAWYPWVLVGFSLCNVFLRQITTQPMK